LFVVPRSNPQPIEAAKIAANTRSASAERQRGAASGTFLLHTDSAGRGSDTVPGRAGSSNSATSVPAVNNSSLAPSPAPATAIDTPSARNGMQRLMDTMSALGMSTSGLNISYSEEAVGYPGGSYMNRLINVTSGGKTEHFSAELTARNPMVTAYELQRYFGVTPNAGGATGTVRQG
jgi:hypothetical protein